MVNVFVYGTLKTGGPNHYLLDGSTLVAFSDRVKGKLYDVGGMYPAYVHGEGQVTGEVWLISTDTLYELDKLEGYPELYDRAEIVTAEGHKAWIYVWNQDYSLLPRVLSGHWEIKGRS